jgi:uncharacterized protein (DUF1778 family)
MPVDESVMILADRSRFRLSAEKWAAFQAALEAPPQPAPQLARLLGEPSLFDHGRKKAPDRPIAKSGA